MTKIEIFDPALCCSSGVCGTEVDQALVNFAADFDWAKVQGAGRLLFCFSPARAGWVKP